MAKATRPPLSANPGDRDRSARAKDLLERDSRAKLRTFSVTIPADLHRRIRMAGVQQDLTLRTICKEAFAEWLERHGGEYA